MLLIPSSDVTESDVQVKIRPLFNTIYLVPCTQVHHQGVFTFKKKKTTPKNRGGMRRTDLLLNILAILKRIQHPYYTKQGRSNGTSNSIFLYGFTNIGFLLFTQVITGALLYQVSTGTQLVWSRMLMWQPPYCSDGRCLCTDSKLSLQNNT